MGNKKKETMSLHTLGEIVLSCLERTDGGSPRLALEEVASRVLDAIGPRPDGEILQTPDPVSSAFVELLDQIVFEMDENGEARGGKVEEYILDDLYKRLKIFLSLCEGLDSYRKKLNFRVITADDALIISHYSLTDLVATLMSEFFEEPHLRFPILHAMVSFESEDLVGFLYEIARGKYDTDLRVLALIGLHMNDYGRINGWSMLGESDEQDFASLIRHVKGLPDAGPATGCVLLFRALEIEFAARRMEGPDDCGALLASLRELLRHDLDGVSMKSRIFESLSRVLDLLRRDALRRHLGGEESFRDFIRLLDRIPAGLFERAPRLVEYLGEDIVTAMERMAGGDWARSDGPGSSLSAYLMSTGYDPPLL